jgi:exonuclease III
MTDPARLPQLSIASINCNSLNMSNTGNFNHKLKMYGITRLKTDIITLCDIRLCNAQNVTSCREAELTFRTNPHSSYEFYANSTMNRRGVGILLKRSSSFSVLVGGVERQGRKLPPAEG